MKKKSASRSAFFNVRVLIGLFILLAGVFLALAGLGTFSAITASSAQAQQKHKIINIPGLPPGFDCSKIHELGIDKMESLRAGLIMIACGESPGGSTSKAGRFSQFVQKLLPVPLAFGAADVDQVTGTETPPHVIQSETYSTANPDNPLEIGVAYNDSRCAASNNFSAASFSTDGGTTFTRLTNGSGCSPFANTFGDPVLLYNKPTGTWFTVWIDANGSCTLGGYKSLTPEDPNSWTHFCVHNSGGDDRESGWADNNPSSPHFGNMYVSWNDFNFPNANIFVSRSTDNGLTWSSATMVSTQNTFIRNTQITGDMGGNGTIYIAGMDEGGGGFPHNDTNLIFKSTDGGVTWSNTSTGTPFTSPAGTLLATWYDARESASCTVGNSGVPCYRMWSRKSNDNGLSWLPDDMLSDVVSPLPAQPDPNIVSVYVGDYDYGAAIATKHVTSWADGRVAIGGQSQQDAFTDRELVGFAVTTTDPACGSVVSTQPTQFVVNLSDAVNEGTVAPGDFTVNGTPADSDAFSNGDQTITFTFNSSPVVNQGEQTMHIPADAFTRQSDGQGVFEFLCTFRYDETLLAVTDTVPPDGGTFQPPGPASYPLDMNFNEPVDPASVQTSDLHLSGVPGSTVTAVSVINGDMTAEFTINITSIFSGTLTVNLPAGAVTDQFGNPGAAI